MSSRDVGRIDFTLFGCVKVANLLMAKLECSGRLWCVGAGLCVAWRCGARPEVGLDALEVFSNLEIL